MDPDFAQTPPDSPAPTPEGATSAKWYRGRPGLIVLTAFITELVLIGGSANQGVAKSLQNFADDRVRTMPDYTAGAIQSALTFQWRFAPANGQSTHAWAAQLAAIATLFVLTALFGWAVSRGSVTLGRVWIGMGAVVAASTPVAIMVRNLLVQPSSPGPLQSRFGQSVYGYAEFGPVIVEGLILGLVVGFFAALLAVITRTRLNVVVLPEPRVNGDDLGEESDQIPDNAYGVPTPGYSPPPWQQYDAPAPWPPAAVTPQSTPSSGPMGTTALPVPVPTPPWRPPVTPETHNEGHTEVIPAYASSAPAEPAAADRAVAPASPSSSPPPSAEPRPDAPGGTSPSDHTQQIPVVPHDAQSQQRPVPAPQPVEQQSRPVSGHSPEPLADPGPDPDLDFDEDRPTDRPTD